MSSCKVLFDRSFVSLIEEHNFLSGLHNKTKGASQKKNAA